MIIDRIRRWWDDRAWHPPEEVEQVREQRATELHEEAIAARLDLEASTKVVDKRLGRIERLAASYAREEAPRRSRPARS